MPIFYFHPQRHFQSQVLLASYSVMQFVIRIMFPTGAAGFLQVEAWDTTHGVKAAIQELTGVPTNQLRLMFAGIELEDGRTLSDYSIGARCDLRVLRVL